MGSTGRTVLITGASSGTEHAAHDGDKVPPEDVAVGIADAIDSDAFEHHLPDMKAVALFETEHIDDYLRLSTQAQGA